MDDRANYWTRVATRRLTRRRMLVVAGSAAVAASLAACGGDDDDDGVGASPAGGSPQVSPTVDPTAGYSALPAGRHGGKANVALTLEPGTLDAHTPGSGGDAPYLNSMYNALVGLDRLTATAAVSLAEKWEVADPTTINFTLKKGITFHDGTPFNANAVKVNVGRILDPDLKATWASQLAAVDRVETPDENTARFVLKRPDAALIFALASVYGAGMISPTALEKYGKDIKSNPVGTGPFLFERWATGSHVVVKRNPNYWEKDAAGKNLPYLDEVQLSAIPDATVRYSNLQTGDATFGGIDAKDIAAAERHANLLVVKGVPGAGVNALLHYNIAIAPMDNVNLRKAVAWSIDPSVIARNVYFDLAVPAEGAMTTPGSWAYSPVPDRPRFDLNKAKEFLRAGGKPDGFEMEVLTYTAPAINQQTEIYQEQWAKIGIKTKVTTQEVSTAVTTFFGPGTQTFPLMSTSWGGTSVEPSTTPTIAWGKASFYNPAKQPLDPRLDDLLVKARETYNEEERKKLYQEIDKIVVAEQCAFVPLLYSQPRGIFRKNVGNTEAFYYGGFNRLQHYYLA
jgi:peptide/nickel transport system substrate-binding protein